MTQNSVLTGGQDGGHPPPVLGDVAVADGVDALKEAVKAAACEPVIDAAVAETDLAQLTPGDDAVLASGQVRDFIVSFHYGRKG